MTARHRKKARLARIGAMVSAAAAAGTAAEVLRRFRRDLRRARTRISTGRIAQTALGPIEYSSAGEGPPVLVVHGAGGGFDEGMDLGSALAPKGFRVIAVSRFGYLRTSSPTQPAATSG